MRIMSLLVAALVMVTLYLVVFQREELLAFAAGEPAGAEDENAAAPADAETAGSSEPVEETAPEGDDRAVPVVVLASQAEPIEQVVLVRGRTEAIRQVEVMAETNGTVVSDPLRKGSFVEQGDVLCEIDPGTRAVTLDEAKARLAEARAALPAARARLLEAEAALPAAEAAIAEAKARVPEAEARLAEARASVPTAEAALAEALAQVPTAEARLAEAEASVPTAEARLVEARSSIPAAEARLSEARASVPTAAARLAEAEANVPAAEARLEEAKAGVPAAEANLAQARAGLPAAEAAVAEMRARVEEAEINLNAASQLSDSGYGSQTRLAAAKAAHEAAKAGLQNALSQLEGAKAAVQNALSVLQGAKAAVATARGQVESAKASVAAAKGQVESAKAAVESAKQQVESAKASVQSAKGQVESAKASVQSAKGQVEGAKAAVQSAKGQVESAKAAVQSAKSGVESASTGIISAESNLEGAKAAVETAKSGVESAMAGIQSAEAAVASAEKDIERLTITAPFAGLLETDTAELGSLLNAQMGGLCATIIQLDPIKLVGFIPEAQVDMVDLGARAGARLASGGRQVIGEVTFLSRSADPSTRTFRVEIEIPNPNLEIRDGQTAEIVIESGTQVAHLVPQSALTLDDEGVLGLRVVEAGNRVGFRPVEMLRDTQDGIYVTGLGEEADVIVVGQEYVTEGVLVKPSYRETSE